MAPTPTVAAAAGTLIYLISYGDTEVPAEALALDKEVDYMPDGNIVMTNANGHMSALAFGLLFGNEGKTNWSKFWAFVKRTHPSIDALPKTILTDQDKGLIAAVKDIFERAA